MRALALFPVTLAALNVAVLAFVGDYDLRLGPVHLAAHGLFKPILYLNAAVLLALLIRGRAAAPTALSWSPNPWLTAAIAALLYAPTASLHWPIADWAHQAVSAAHPTVWSLCRYFVEAQPDRFYRPLVFISLWLDFQIFGSSNFGYHLQNIAFHAVNCVLVARLGPRLGLPEHVSRWAALLFGVAAVNYEAVMWPGARFDLMASCFTFAALGCALDWLKTEAAGGRRALLAVGGFYVLALLSKESAYCLPLVLVFVFLTRRTWSLPTLNRTKAALLVAVTGALSVVFLALRVSIYGGLGGYAAERGAAASPQFTLQLSTFTSFFTRALPTPLFALNTSDPLPLVLQCAVLGFAVAALAYAASAAAPLRLKLGLLALTLICAIPAVNLVGWISPFMHNTRYLYLPAIWIFYLLAAGALAPSGVRRLSPLHWLILICVLNAVAAVYNYQHFRWYEVPLAPQ